MFYELIVFKKEDDILRKKRLALWKRPVMLF